MSRARTSGGSALSTPRRVAGPAGFGRLAAALVLAIAPLLSAHAAEPGRSTELSRLRASRDHQAREVARWSALLQTRSQRVATLRAQGARPDRDPLQGALRGAVETEQGLARAERHLRAASQQLAEALTQRIQAIDRASRALAPRLRSGPMADRRAAAHRLASLREERSALVAELRALRRPEEGGGIDPAWLRPQLEASPLDGPEELREKADFLDDAGDKLARRRRELLAVLERTEREGRLRRAAAALTDDSRLFDEETRPGRVLRSGGAAGAPERSTNEGSESDPVTDVAAPGGPQSGFDDASLDGQRRSPGRGEDPSDRAALAPGPRPRRDLGALLAVEPRPPAAADASPAELKAWLEQLERAERRLRARASTLRTRAGELDR